MSLKLRFFLVVLFLGLIVVAGKEVLTYEGSSNKHLSKDYGDALVIGAISDASVMVPMIATDVMSHTIGGHLFLGVVKYGPDLNLVGELAERFEISEDQRTITFYLRKGVKWSDGVEVTSEDIAFGYRLITDPKIPTPYASDFQEVEKFEVLDPYTFRVTYKKPFALALSSWGNLVVLPKHLLEGKDLDYLRNVFGRKPVGNGPFMLVHWKPQQEILLKANPLYYKGRPYLNYLIYRIIPDPTTLFMELRSGGIDWVPLTPLQYLKLQKEKEVEKFFQVYKYPAFSFTYIGYNLAHPFFKDQRVRKALCLAIDKHKIVKGALLGQGIPAYGPYKPDAWFYNPEIEKSCPYDPQKALALLFEAGFKKNEKGLLEKDGKIFEFTLLVNQGNLPRLLAAQIVQQELFKIGIKVNIRTLEWTTLIHQFIDKRRFEAVILGWSTGPDPDLYDIFHSSKKNSPGLNFVGYVNPELDKLLEEGRYTLDKKRRKKIYAKIQEILAEDQPYTFLYIPMSLEAISVRIQEVKTSAIGIGYNLEEWWVPKEKQKYLIP
ncbi:peptide-binding protein [Thermodesulfobacterium sp. TA1]|uniref:peptide-binding protein n=1 Tax=Thermodesulfobacterium sp. TA1 TaxID=2234087 RepID=UPI001231B797|nr:peptide-binding protein [Thermodesulfobacterium sp. TA1]QER41831.1 peptide-binding protein [Thermodesulfobacterium sp. TA1]